MSNCESFNFIDSAAPLRFDLYDEDKPLDRRAEVKSFKTNDEGMALYKREKSDDYFILAERLLWVNGWEKTIGEGETATKKGPLTLVVLKLVISSRDPKNIHLSRISATLEFANTKKARYASASEPKVVAWAPFHNYQRSNKTIVHSRQVTKTEGNATVGYSGSSLALGRTKEEEIAWDQNNFDEAYSDTVTSKAGNRIGVKWMVTRSAYQQHPMQQVIHAAVLLSTEPESPYIVKFSFSVQAGTLATIQDKFQKFLGMGPDKTKDFVVTPGKNIVNDEGEGILQSIDLNNLGKLRGEEDPSSLILKWGLMPQPLESNMQGIAVVAISEAGCKVGREKEDLSEKGHRTFSGYTSSQGAYIAPESYSSSRNIDYTRLAALEARQAQVEARIAAQDMVLLKLQQEILGFGKQLPSTK